MFDRFSDRARKVMGLARQEAQRFNHDYIGTEHILLGVIQEGSGVAASVLKNLDVDLKALKKETEKAVTSGTSMVTMGQLPFTPRAKKTLELSLEEASNLGHTYIGTEHLLLGLIREQEGVAAKALRTLNVRLEDVREETVELLGADPHDEEEDSPPPERSKTPALDAFGRDLTDLARDGKLDPAIGRDAEVQRVIQILSRRSNNSPVLLGAAGVGKMDVTNALAQAIVRLDVPRALLRQRLVSLDFPMMVAGTKYRGQFEERIKAVLTEVRRSRNIILIIDDVRALAGSGSWASVDSGGGGKLAGILSPALRRGEVQIIASGTMSDFDMWIDENPGLRSCFTAVAVAPPSEENTYTILDSLRRSYERHHNVKYTDAALRQAIDLSVLHMPERHLPGKAIDILDEAGARVRVHEEESRPDLTHLEAEVARLERDKTEAVANQKFDVAAEHRDSALKIRKKIEVKLHKWRQALKDSPCTIDEAEIEAAVEEMTGSRRLLLGPDHGSDGSGGVARHVPEYEWLQAQSVLLGSGVNIKRGTGFVLIPHNEGFDGIYRNVIRPAMEANALEAVKADDIYTPGQILAQVWERIRTAEVIVADVSTVNPNVIHELGLCYGLHRCPILLVRDPSELPFNVRNLRYIQYEDSSDGAARLKETLTETIRAFLHQVRGPAKRTMAAPETTQPEARPRQGPPLR